MIDTIDEMKEFLKLDNYILVDNRTWNEYIGKESGWIAAETYWDAMVMGLYNTSLYSDGWIAWSNEGNPYVTGDATK